MPMMNMKYRLTVVESERGWGQRHEYEYFDSREAAEKRADRINGENTLSYVPDWYMRAEKSSIKLVPASEAK